MATSANPPSESDAALDPALPQKKRARRRLVGAIALCLAAVIVFPLLFDHEPHRGSEPVTVQIPSRDTPLPAGDAARAPVPASSTPASPDSASGAGVPPASGSPAAGKADPGRQGDARTAEGRPPAAKADAKAASRPEPRHDAKAEPRHDAKAETRAEPPKAATDARAKDKAKDTKVADGKRYLLQVGAFATDKGAADQAEKVRATGLAVFTERVRTPQGERIRVRVGPFTSREQAEQARGQLKLAGIESALIAP